MDPEIVKSLNDASSKGKAMFDEFVKERIEDARKPLSDVIPRLKMYTSAISHLLISKRESVR